MYFLIKILIASVFISGRVICYPNDDLMKKDQKNVEDGMTKSFKSIPETEESILRLPISLGDLSISENQNTEKDPLDFFRLRRSYVPYTSGRMKSKKRIDLGSWVTDVYYRERIHSTPKPIHEEPVFEGHPKITPFNPKGPKPVTRIKGPSTTSERTFKSMMNNYRNMRSDYDYAKPVWDLREYRSGERQSRFSRSSGGSPENFHIPSSGKPRLSDSDKYIAENVGGIIEIPSFFSSSNQKPDQCSLAILSCCSKYSDSINRRCFIAAGCEQVLFNDYLCKKEYKQIAVYLISNFYNSK